MAQEFPGPGQNLEANQEEERQGARKGHKLINGVNMSESLSCHQDTEGLVMRYLQNPRPDLKDLILVQYSGLVERIARRFAGVESFEDLVQVGYIGLLNALSKYDASEGVKFNTYANYLIAGEIKHYLRDRAMTIRHPAWLQELRQRVVKSAALLQQELGRVPTEREIADSIDVSEAAVKEVFQTQEMMKIGSLDQSLPGEENSDTERPELSFNCPEQLTVEDRLVLEHAMTQLRDLEREVLVLFHFDSLNQSEIADKLGISCNYVSHILRQSLSKLRKILTVEAEKDRILKRQSFELEYDVVDPETGAYTESFFRSRMQEELHRANAEGAQVALVLFKFSGLDNLSKFYGEQSVKDFLSDAADFLRANTRRLDMVCRHGKTGFALVFPETGHKLGIVRRLLLKRAVEWMQGRYSERSGIGLEIGAAVAPEDGKTLEEVLTVATPQAEQAIKQYLNQLPDAA